jgi:hypothetical protein
MAQTRFKVRSWARALHTAPATAVASSVLLRDFVQDALYNARHGYFGAPDNKVVGVLPEPLNFQRMLDRAGYSSAVAAAYVAGGGRSWFTPSELFKPMYSTGLARFILRRWQQQQQSRPLRVYEIGGGSGTNASCFLDAVQRLSPDVYASIRYINVEISAPLAEAQRAACARHAHVHRVLQHDAALPAAWGARYDAPCFVLALEVLDNLPHDRVVLDESGWKETHISEGPPLREELWPVSDALIARCLDIYRRHAESGSLWSRGWKRLQAAAGGGSDHIVFLPTRCLQLLDTLAAARPQHVLIAADFDALPGVRIAGVNAPLVAAHAGVDLSSYLDAKGGNADIMFPTDFGLLQAMRASVANSAGGEVFRSSTFFGQCLEPQELRLASTASGFTPLLHDFENTRVFVG